MAGRWRRMFVTGVSGAAIIVALGTWGAGVAVADGTRELTFWQAAGKKPDSIFHFKAPTIMIGAGIPSAVPEEPKVTVANDQPPLPKAAPRSRVERQVLAEPAQAPWVEKEGTFQPAPAQNASPPVTTIARVDDPLPSRQPQPGEPVVAAAAGPVGEDARQDPVMDPGATQAPPEDKPIGSAQALGSDAAEDRAGGKDAVPEIIEDNSGGFPIQAAAGIAFCCLVAGIMIGGTGVWKYGAKLLPAPPSPIREGDTVPDMIQPPALTLPPWMEGLSVAIARQYDPSVIPAWMISSDFRASLAAAAARRAA